MLPAVCKNMFTGIITHPGTIQAVSGTGARRLMVGTKMSLEDVALGASIACSGVCLTVVGKAPATFTVDVSPETLARTTVGAWQTGTVVNLERALRLGDELGGHLVTGHVDGLGVLRERMQDAGGNWVLRFSLPQELAAFVAQKGSITIDGVSLTVNSVTEDSFVVNIIPHTAAVTTLGRLGVRGTVNLEIDVIARYVSRALAFGTGI
jgi:riboflavin synthase